jgi:hypothetical protein
MFWAGWWMVTGDWEDGDSRRQRAIRGVADEPVQCARHPFPQGKGPGVRFAAGEPLSLI